jgi:hypothetical protein
VKQLTPHEALEILSDNGQRYNADETNNAMLVIINRLQELELVNARLEKEIREVLKK